MRLFTVFVLFITLITGIAHAKGVPDSLEEKALATARDKIVKQYGRFDFRYKRIGKLLYIAYGNFRSDQRYKFVTRAGMYVERYDLNGNRILFGDGAERIYINDLTSSDRAFEYGMVDFNIYNDYLIYTRTLAKFKSINTQVKGYIVKAVNLKNTSQLIQKEIIQDDLNYYYSFFTIDSEIRNEVLYSTVSSARADTYPNIPQEQVKYNFELDLRDLL